MPRMTVKLHEPDGQTGHTVLDEIVGPAQLDSEGSAAAFIERLGWAIVDAHDQEAEDAGTRPTADRPATGTS
jgi:hypothetical protein